MLICGALLVALAAATIAWLWLRHVYSFWAREGQPHLRPTIPFGNLADVIMRRSSFGINLYNLYRASADSTLFTGIYLLYRPALLILDADVAHDMLTENFNSFHDRGTFHSPQHDPLTSHLFNMTGDTWRTYRAKLTPTFTAGKLRSMMSTILAEGENLQRYMQPMAAGRQVVKMKCLVDRFALNIIGSVGFGMDIDTIRNPKHDFLEIEKVINCPGISNTLRFALAFLCPSVLHFFKTYANTAHVRQYFVDLCADAIKHREQNHIVRKDFMQLLLQLRNTGTVSADGDWRLPATAHGARKSLSLNDCAAQTFLFYTAGFDTSSSALTYCLYELVRNPQVMRKLQLEIDETLERHDGAITYDAIHEMHYLELCILESVRKYPTLPLLNRVCTADYRVADANYTIRTGTPVVISIMGFARDAKYFPQPERFWPERFEPATNAYHANAFIPFGDGPRQCIGSRLGKMMAKVGLVQLLKSFDFECADPNEIEFDNYAVTLIPRGGVEIRVVPRKD